MKQLLSFRLRLRQRRGFTLIEILVVIAIILVLLGLFFAGARQWRANSDRHTTSVRMQILDGWLVDLRSASPNTYKLYFVDTTYTNVDAGSVGNVTADSTANRSQAISYMLVPSGGTSPSGIMAFLSKQPAVIQSFTKLPTDATEKGVMLDGWNNPILYIPAVGIHYPNISQSVTSPDGRPFWVSAGPDGDFSTPADNIYSFNQQP